MRVMVFLLCALQLGCWSRYQLRAASIGVTRTIHCEEDEMSLETEGPGYIGRCNVEGHPSYGREAYCVDTGEWKCFEIKPHEELAMRQVSFDANCPPARVTSRGVSSASKLRGDVRVDACGTSWVCAVDEGRATCRADAGAEASAGTPPAVSTEATAPRAPAGSRTPLGVVRAPPAPAPGPAASAAACRPPCRAGFTCDDGVCTRACTPACDGTHVCIDGRCMSKCNPPCEAGERCTTDGVCVPGR